MTTGFELPRKWFPILRALPDSAGIFPEQAGALYHDTADVCWRAFFRFWSQPAGVEFPAVNSIGSTMPDRITWLITLISSHLEWDNLEDVLSCSLPEALLTYRVTCTLRHIMLLCFLISPSFLPPTKALWDASQTNCLQLMPCVRLSFKGNPAVDPNQTVINYENSINRVQMCKHHCTNLF